ncbi:MAG: MarR family winged helix-turn-helix transcriptional regulator [Methylococcales bacterium]
MEQIPHIQKKNCLNFKMRKLTRLLTKMYDAELSKAGIKTTQFTLLCHVLKYDSAPLSDIARIMGVDTSTLSRNLQPLISAGFIIQTTGSDARRRLVSLTSEGRSKQAEADLHWAVAQDKIKAILGLKNVTALSVLLDSCIDKLQQD